MRAMYVQAHKDLENFPDRVVVVDFGLPEPVPLSQESEPKPPISKEQLVCDMLAIEYDPATVWSMSFNSWSLEVIFEAHNIP